MPQQFTATTRVPTRPLSYANRDMAYRKELVVDYTYGLIYVVDENGNLIDISQKVYEKLVENGDIGSGNITVVVPNPDNPEDESDTIIVSLQEAITDILSQLDVIKGNMEQIQEIVKLFTNESGEIEISAGDIVTDATHQFVTQLQLQQMAQKVSMSEVIVTINPDNVSGSSAPYVATVAVAGVHPNYPPPILDISYTNDLYATNEEEEDAFYTIYRCKITTANEATIYFREKPSISFNVRFVIFTPGLDGVEST